MDILSMKTIKSNLNEPFIDNLGDFLSDNLSKIKGFNYQWSSLITSSPLLFEDIDYLRVREFVRNEISETELNAYRDGNLREIFATFENLLICCLPYYDRIISYCTISFLHYVRISDEEVSMVNLNEIPFYFDLTPTQIWCAAMCSSSSTQWEIDYGWQLAKKEAIDMPKAEDLR